MLKDVDEADFFDETTPEKVLNKILPDILFKGSDYKAKDVVGYEMIKKNGGDIKIISKLSNFSTSKLIQS